MHQFLARPRLAHQYCASRRLEASGSGHRAWLDVQTDFALASGLQYSVTAEGGSGYIRTRVLRSLLEEEQRLIARGRASTVAISTDNYQFTPDGLDEHGFAVVRLRPLRKDRSLIVGRMFLTPMATCSQLKATRQESVLLGHASDRRPRVSPHQRSLDARLARDDRTTETAWISGAPHDLSLFAGRRSSRAGFGAHAELKPGESTGHG
jgi:hypothetical protein